MTPGDEQTDDWPERWRSMTARADRYRALRAACTQLDPKEAARLVVAKLLWFVHLHQVETLLGMGCTVWIVDRRGYPAFLSNTETKKVLNVIDVCCGKVGTPTTLNPCGEITLESCGEFELGP